MTITIVTAEDKKPLEGAAAVAFFTKEKVDTVEYIRSKTLQDPPEGLLRWFNELNLSNQERTDMMAILNHSSGSNSLSYRHFVAHSFIAQAISDDFVGKTRLEVLMALKNINTHLGISPGPKKPSLGNAAGHGSEQKAEDASRLAYADMSRASFEDTVNKAMEGIADWGDNIYLGPGQNTGSMVGLDWPRVVCNKPPGMSDAAFRAAQEKLQDYEAKETARLRAAAEKLNGALPRLAGIYAKGIRGGDLVKDLSNGPQRVAASSPPDANNNSRKRSSDGGSQQDAKAQKLNADGMGSGQIKAML